MKVTLTIDGGLAYVPGLARPIVADAERLSADVAAELRRLCHAALGVPRGTEVPRSTPVPDGRRYRLTVAMDGAPVEIAAADPIRHHAIAELIEFVEARGKR